MKLKACFICSEYPPGLHGGIGTFTQLLARSLRRRGHDVRVIGVYRPALADPPYQEDEGVRVWRLPEPARRGGWIAARYALYRTVREWSRRGEIDFVEAPDWNGWTAGWRGLGVPVITRLHGSTSYFAAEMGESTPRLTHWLERAAIRGADFRCSVSQYTARRTAALFDLGEPDRVVYNAIELPPHPSAGARSGHHVVFSGTLTRKKGIGSLMRAWPAVRAACPKAELHMYGKSTPDTAPRFPDGGPGIVWHGHVSRAELLQALGLARVAVFPSYAEAFAMAPLEAMACGCPTIYTRRGSGPELAEDGREVLLVDPDDHDEIARTLLRVLVDDDLASRLGNAGRLAVESRFSLEALVQENETFYRACLNDGRPTGFDHRLHVSTR